jgi:hypothetical protein
MKKIISIAVCAAVLGLVGCSTGPVQDKSDASSYRENISQVDADHGTKCKGHKCHKKCHKCHEHKCGKLGEEKAECDMSK